MTRTLPPPTLSARRDRALVRSVKLRIPRDGRSPRLRTRPTTVNVRPASSARGGELTETTDSRAAASAPAGHTSAATTRTRTVRRKGRRTLPPGRTVVKFLGRPRKMHIAHMENLSEQWVEGRPDLRWRSTLGTTPDDGAEASSTTLLELDPGCALPRHTDSAEETVVVVSGTAEIELEHETATVRAGGVALVPKDAPHQVRNAADEPLRFVAVYAGTNVVTTYEDDVQPSGEKEQQTVGG
jgi:quercetin dioxygenase-like cupin family protein